MDIPGIVKYEASIGLKRATGAGIGAVMGFLGTPAVATALSSLKVIGLTITIDTPVFEKWLVGASTVLMVGAHDYLRTKFPAWKI